MHIEEKESEGKRWRDKVQKEGRKSGLKKRGRTGDVYDRIRGKGERLKCK